MAESPTGPTGDEHPDPDNVRRIHRLVRMMQQYDLTAIDLVEGPTKIRLRRRLEHSAAPASPASSPMMPMAPSASPPATAPPQPAPPPPPAAEPSGTFIESPMVGTFYQSGSPEAPAFISVGSMVRPETTVCIIEAMKVFTEIPAGVSGRIAEILVQDKQPVEFGQPLFRVEPS
jgi:acetyl-CoA carboxylase biotin carboxyl carrier protein